MIREESEETQDYVCGMLAISCEATQAESLTQFMQQEFCREYRTPDASEQWAGGEEKEYWDYEKEVGGIKAQRWILWWILIGVKMHMVEAVEEEIPARQEMERMLETALVPRVGNIDGLCDKGWKERDH